MTTEKTSVTRTDICRLHRERVNDRTGGVRRVLVSLSKHDNIGIVALKRKRVFNKCLRDTEYAVASAPLFEHKPEELRDIG